MTEGEAVSIEVRGGVLHADSVSYNVLQDEHVSDILRYDHVSYIGVGT